MSFKDKILNNQSPWGTPGGDGDEAHQKWIGIKTDPPSIDDIIKNFQKTINKFSAVNREGSRPIIVDINSYFALCRKRSL